eukprot:jgi/Bigna1/80779/fgenesh1_pg.74_\
MEPLWGRFGLLLCTLLVILAPSSLANFIEVNNFEVGCQEADLNEIQSYEECVLAAHTLNWESKNVTVRSDDGPANCYHNHDVGATFKADNVPTGNCDYDCACKQQSTTTPTTTPSLSTGNPAVQVLMPSMNHFHTYLFCAAEHFYFSNGHCSPNSFFTNSRITFNSLIIPCDFSLRCNKPNK